MQCPLIQRSNIVLTDREIAEHASCTSPLAIRRHLRVATADPFFPGF